MQKLTDTLRKDLNGENSTRLIVLLGAAGIALILLAGLLPERRAPAEAEPVQAETAGFPEPDSYRHMLEDQLTALLSQMDGVGTVTVMLTVSGSAEQIYAEEVKSDRSDSSARSESRFVITKADGSESALLSGTKYPAVQGAAILCSGGGHAAVQERVSSAVSVVLGLPASRIFVGKAAVSSISERSTSP